MPFTTGTATDHHDLLDKLQTYLAAQGWTVNNFDLGATLTDPSLLDVTGPGQAGGQEVNISIKTQADAGTNAYAWRISAYPDYDADNDFAAQVNNSPIVYYRLWPNAMDYWFYVNDRRFVVVAKIGTYYMSMYAGFFLPYALPSEYPFPYFIGATSQTLGAYNTADAGIRNFCDPGPGSAFYLTRGGMFWQNVRNSGSGSNVVDAYQGIGASACIWPHKQAQGEDDTNATEDIGWSFFRLMRPLANGKMPMYQAHILDAANNIMAGTLDEIFFTGGFNKVPEQVVSVGADDYRLFINVNRNTSNHYFAIKEA